jgi:hypothetical protein
LSYDNPFWFANDELLTDLLRVEVHFVAQYFANYPDLSEFFDIPKATIEQRTVCFAVLAHCALMHEIYETFAGRQEQSPSLGEEEKDVLRRTRTLFDSDAPTWVLELNEVAQRLPARIYEALPEPLRRGSGFYANDPVQTEHIASAARDLSSVERIQALVERVFREQLQRLEGRWSASIFLLSNSQSVQQPITTSTKQTRRTINREGWEQRLKLYRAIQNVLTRDSSLQGIEFCAQLDTRHAPPLYDWVKAGQWREGLTWKEAWNDPRLRKKIRRVRQEAMKSG